MEARAESIVRSSIRPVPRDRAMDDAVRAADLVFELVDSGLYEDARAVKLLEAEALLEAGDLTAAERSARAAADLGAGNGEANRARRVPLIATELHTRVVAARTRPRPRPAVIRDSRTSVAGSMNSPPIRRSSAPRTCSPRPPCTASN